MTTKSQNGLLSRHELGTQIVSLTNKVVSLEEAIQRVRDFHKPITTQYDNENKTEYIGCAECGDEGWDGTFYHHEYPCDTIKALDGEK